MRIISLKAENVKRIKAIEIVPDPEKGLVIISGKNEAGKSSALDCIAFAIGGERLIQKQPIRKGADKAIVELDLGEYTVKRTWTSDEKTYLTLKNKEGHGLTSPQKILDKLTGDLTFDPLEFADMSGKEQAQVLLDVAGIDFTELNEKRHKIFEERTDEGRRLRDLRGELEGLEEPEKGLPEKEVSLAELNQEWADAVVTNSTNGRTREGLKAITRKLVDLDTEIEALKAQLKDAQEDRAETAKEHDRFGKDVAALKDLDTNAIQVKIDSAEETNAAIRAANYFKIAKSRYDAQKKKADALTKQIDKIDQERVDVLSKAKFPVKGLSLTGTGIAYNGIPFEQESTSSRLKISLQVAMALNPELRFIRIDNGSCLDQDNLKTIESIAAIKGYHIWIERVGDDAGATVVIEDGEVKTV